jgi:hypothetical protein
MSKISEQKALEAYPPCINSNGFDLAEARREGYTKGYDQAMQDFLEKADEFLYLQLNNGSIECGNVKNLFKQLKNYMEDEV